MLKTSMKAGATAVACLGLSGCIQAREHVLAPSAAGRVIDVSTGKPVTGALVSYAGLEAAGRAETGPDGTFFLEGYAEKRVGVILPVSGVFRDAATVLASAPGMLEGYASAAFINGDKPAEALHAVTVVLFPADAGKTPLHALTEDCIEAGQQEHAVSLAGYIGGLDPRSPPQWLDQDVAEALYEHLWLTLPASGFQECSEMTAAYELFRSQTERLRAITDEPSP